jgi:hypothetical protein
MWGAPEGWIPLKMRGWTGSVDAAASVIVDESTGAGRASGASGALVAARLGYHA